MAGGTIGWPAVRHGVQLCTFLCRQRTVVTAFFRSEGRSTAVHMGVLGGRQYLSCTCETIGGSFVLDCATVSPTRPLSTLCSCSIAPHPTLEWTGQCAAHALHVHCLVYWLVRFGQVHRPGLTTCHHMGLHGGMIRCAAWSASCLHSCAFASVLCAVNCFLGGGVPVRLVRLSEPHDWLCEL